MPFLGIKGPPLIGLDSTVRPPGAGLASHPVDLTFSTPLLLLIRMMSTVVLCVSACVVSPRGELSYPTSVINPSYSNKTLFKPLIHNKHARG